MAEKKIIILETDYLIIGAGASGMAFTDELIQNTSNVTVIIVDKHCKPGGHWNDAYDFVKLHQPAAYYGVNSKPLGRGTTDLVSYSEILAYYELVMDEFMGSGRVKYFPRCEYKGHNLFHSLMERGIEYRVKVGKKTVNSYHVGPSVPSVRKPDIEIAKGVNLVPINELSRNEYAWERYVIVGGGKTGIDAVLFLIAQSVDPDRITWVIPNDFWLRNRNDFFNNNWYDSSIRAMEIILGSENYKDLFKKWEDVGYLLRIDKQVEPKVMRGGLVTPEELEKLRTVKDVIRKGRIERIEPGRIFFQNGEHVDIENHTLYVDCTAPGARPFNPQKIFDGTKIIIQDVRLLQSVYSAAVIGAFESFFPEDEEKKNRILKPIEHPQTPAEYVVCMREDYYIEESIGKELGVSWFRKSRLHPLHHIPYTDYVKFMEYTRRNGNKLAQALDKMVNNIGKEKYITN